MDFSKILEEYPEKDSDYAFNPFASHDETGKWFEGRISIKLLNEHFDQYSTAEEMMTATESEGLKLYFAWLRDKGILN